MLSDEVLKSEGCTEFFMGVNVAGQYGDLARSNLCVLLFSVLLAFDSYLFFIAISCFAYLFRTPILHEKISIKMHPIFTK